MEPVAGPLEISKGLSIDILDKLLLKTSHVSKSYTPTLRLLFELTDARCTFQLYSYSPPIPDKTVTSATDVCPRDFTDLPSSSSKPEPCSFSPLLLRSGLHNSAVLHKNYKMKGKPIQLHCNGTRTHFFFASPYPRRWLRHPSSPTHPDPP